MQSGVGQTTATAQPSFIDYLSCPGFFSVSIGLLLPFLWAFHLLAVRELNLILFSAPLNKAQVYGSMNSIEVVNVELAPSARLSCSLSSLAAAIRNETHWAK